jgi:hypothetical protein
VLQIGKTPIVVNDSRASSPPRVRHLRDGGHRHAGRGRAPRAIERRASRPACPCRRWPCRTRCR